jgi:hypothetical protein
VIRSSDGAVTQLVRTKDAAWHAGNWTINSESIGIEHEGIAIDGATWYPNSRAPRRATRRSSTASPFTSPVTTGSWDWPVRWNGPGPRRVSARVPGQSRRRLPLHLCTFEFEIGGFMVRPKTTGSDRTYVKHIRLALRDQDRCVTIS